MYLIYQHRWVLFTMGATSHYATGISRLAGIQFAMGATHHHLIGTYLSCRIVVYPHHGCYLTSAKGYHQTHNAHFANHLTHLTQCGYLLSTLL